MPATSPAIDIGPASFAAGSALNHDIDDQPRPFFTSAPLTLRYDAGADEWRPGATPRYLDKQFLRDWSSSLTDWDRTAPGPEIPEEVVEATRNRYVEFYERLTGDTWR